METSVVLLFLRFDTAASCLGDASYKRKLDDIRKQLYRETGDREVSERMFVYIWRKSKNIR